MSNAQFRPAGLVRGDNLALQAIGLESIALLLITHANKQSPTENELTTIILRVGTAVGTLFRSPKAQFLTLGPVIANIALQLIHLESTALLLITKANPQSPMSNAFATIILLVGTPLGTLS